MSEVIQEVSSSSSSRVVQESSSIVQESSSTKEISSDMQEKMKSLMTEGIDFSEAEGSSSTIVQKSSSSTSQSVSKVSSSVTTTSGDGEPVVTCQIEESSVNEASATCSAVEMKDGEVVSSMEQSGQSRDEAVRNATMEGDSMIETSAQLHQAAMVTKADGDIVQQHQESDFTENRREVNMPQTIENGNDKEELEIT